MNVRQCVTMGVLKLIDLCCLSALAMNFNDINPELIIQLSKDESRDFDTDPPLVVVDGNCWLYECSYYLTRGLALAKDHEQGFDLFMKRFTQRVKWVTQRGFEIVITESSCSTVADCRQNEVRT